MEHGEWTSLGEPGGKETSEINWEPRWVQQWWTTVDEDIALHQEVLNKGYPNRWGAKIPVRTKWNLQLFSSLLQDYEDKEVVEWIRYGWPTGRLPTLENPAITNKNHQAAVDHPKALKKYIEKEQQHNTVMGPFEKIPFKGKVGIAPLSTRPKKDSG